MVDFKVRIIFTHLFMINVEAKIVKLMQCQIHKDQKKVAGQIVLIPDPDSEPQQIRNLPAIDGCFHKTPCRCKIYCAHILAF